MLLDRLLDRTSVVSAPTLLLPTSLLRMVALLGVLFASAPAGAQGRDWVVTEIVGTVLQLDDGGWREVERASAFGGAVAFRTLQRGRLRLQGGDAELRIGPNSVVEVLPGRNLATTLVRHHEGTLSVAAGDSVSGLRIEALSFLIIPQAGTTTVRVTGQTADIQVADSGRAEVTDKVAGRGVTVTAALRLQRGQLPEQAAASTGAGSPGGGDPGQGGTPGGIGRGNDNSAEPSGGGNQGNPGSGGGNTGRNGNAGGGDGQGGGGPPPGAGNPGHGNQGNSNQGTGGPGSGKSGAGGAGSHGANATAGTDNGNDG